MDRSVTRVGRCGKRPKWKKVEVTGTQSGGFSANQSKLWRRARTLNKGCQLHYLILNCTAPRELGCHPYLSKDVPDFAEMSISSYYLPISCTCRALLHDWYSFANTSGNKTWNSLLYEAWFCYLFCISWYQKIDFLIWKVLYVDIKTKRRRSDPVLWQKPLHKQKCQKGKVTTQTTPQKSSIKQRLRTDLGRSVGVCNYSHPTGVVNLVHGLFFPLPATAV